MRTKKKYNWVKEDGFYNIKDVEIFALYEDEQDGVTIDDAKTIVANFNKSKDTDWYPRIHIGHQDYESKDNQRGVGFIDNLRFKNSTFIADFVHVPEEEFKELLNLKYPYRSVEYDASNKRIIGLALLESKPPYFEFPILNLEKLKQFGKKNVTHLLQYEENFMPDEKIPEEKLKENENKPGAEIEEEVREDEKTEPISLTESDMAQIKELIGLKPAIEKLMSDFSNWMKEEKKEPSHQMQEDVEEDSVGAKPDIIAMGCDGKPESKIMKEFEALRKKVEQFEKDNSNVTVYSRLRDICNKNSTLQYESEKEFLDKIEGDKNKKVYLDKLFNQVSQYSIHPATEFARSFKPGEKEGILKQFSAKQQGIAAKAYKDYLDTINQPNENAAKQFAKRFPTAEKYVQFAVDNFEIEGDYTPSYK